MGCSRQSALTHVRHRSSRDQPAADTSEGKLRVTNDGNKSHKRPCAPVVATTVTVLCACSCCFGCVNPTCALAVLVVVGMWHHQSKGGQEATERPLQLHGKQIDGLINYRDKTITIRQYVHNFCWPHIDGQAWYMN